MSMLRGVRVFIVEDEPMLALDLQDMLADLQCQVVGTAARVESALALGRDLVFDIAMLDINLGDQRIDPVAEIIAARGMPILFVSGYGREGVPPHLQGSILEKPYTAAGLQQALENALGLIR